MLLCSRSFRICWHYHSTSPRLQSRNSPWNFRNLRLRQQKTNHNHRPCRWYAQAPLGPFTSQAYRLFKLSFACVSRPTTANAVMYAPKAPSDEGAGFCEAKDWGREFALLVSLPPSSPNGESTSLIRGRLDRCGGTGHSESFLEPPALPVVFFIQSRVPEAIASGTLLITTIRSLPLNNSLSDSLLQ